MPKKHTCLYPAILLLCLSIVAHGDEVSPPKAVPERLMVQVSPPAWLSSLIEEACRLSPEQPLAGAKGPSPVSESRFKVSPDCRHVAYVAVGSDGACVVLDGKEEKQYDSILQGTLSFSPDSKRLAYGAKAGGKSFVVLDGKEQQTYDGILAGTLVFGPDGKRLAYAAKNGEKVLMVVDNKEDQPYEAILAGTVCFSADGRQVAYGAKAGGKAFVVVNGKAGSAHDAILEGTLGFNPGGRVAYGAKLGNKSFMVAYGREETKYDGILKGPPVFSPDGKWMAYGAKLADKRFVVFDGEEEKQYEGIEPGSIAFTPDGRHLAYVAMAGGKQFVVLDRKEQQRYDRILAGTPIFSPDGQKMAYAAMLGGKTFVVLDGKEDKQYDAIGLGSLSFSPDGKRLAYAARMGGKWFLAVDGNELKDYDFLTGLAFSPDGKRLACIARQGDRACVVVEGKEEPRFDGVLIVAGARVVFDSPTYFHYLAVRGDHIYLAGNYPQVVEDPELETAIASLRHVELDKMDAVQRWNKLKEIERASALIQSRGEIGRFMLVWELDRIKTAKERDNFFTLSAAALFWRLGRLDQAGTVAEIWNSAPLAARYEEVFHPAFEAAQTQDPRALPMLRSCLDDADGSLFLGEHSLRLAWPLTHEFLWGAFGPKGLPSLASVLETSSNAKALQAAMLILSKAQYLPGLALCRKYAADQRLEVRGAALVSLGRFGHPEDYEQLVVGLKDDADDLVYRIYAVGLYEDLRAVPALTSLFRYKSGSLKQARLAAIDALKILLTTESVRVLERHARMAQDEEEQKACREFLAQFLSQLNVTWDEYLNRSEEWQESAVFYYQRRDLLLRPDERVLTHGELVEALGEWKKSRGIAGSACGWVEPRLALPAATADDLELLLETRASFYARLSDECLHDVGRIDEFIERLGRSRYRGEAGITKKAEAR